MKRVLAILTVVLLSSVAIKAQDDEIIDTFKVADFPVDVPYRVGIRGGLNLANMHYSNPAPTMGLYQHTLQPFGLGNIFVHIGFGKSGFSITPEFGVTGKGVGLNWLDVDYKMAVRYLDFRMPLAYNFRLLKSPALSPYIMVAPQFDMPYEGKIDYTAYDYPDGVSVDITQADVAPYDVSVTVGGGIDYLVKTKNFPIIFSLEAGYNIGVVNNFAVRENLDENGRAVDNASIIANPFFGAELWRNERRSSGIEVAARVALPLSGYRPKPKPVVEEPMMDIPYMIALPQPEPPAPPDTVVVEVVVQDTTPPKKPDTVIVNGREYVKKDCYSLSEMFSFITLGIDISDKRICMYNINFDFNSAKLRPESSVPLNEVLMLMKTFPEINIEVYGHTDSIGSEKYNQGLSERRAQSAAQYLIDHGIEASRITSVGFGLKLPIDTNETEEGRFHNRRVEFEILNVENIKRESIPQKEEDAEGETNVSE